MTYYKATENEWIDDITKAIQNFYDLGILSESNLDEDSKITQCNCRNCGAPINPYQEKCEYCNTYYNYGNNDDFYKELGIYSL